MPDVHAPASASPTLRVMVSDPKRTETMTTEADRTFLVRIDMGNAAFGDGDDATREIARILRDLAHHLAQTDWFGPQKLRDVNGNPVGEAWIRERRRADEEVDR